MAALGIQSCSLKRHIPKGQYLINKVKIKGGPSTYSEDLYNLLREKPNKKILGLFRANMWFYLWSKKPSKAQEQLENGVWEAPVLVDSLKLSTSASQMQDFLFNKGYFHNKVSFNVEKKRINLRSRIRNVRFHITPGERFNINKVGYNILDPRIKKIFFDHLDESLLYSGMPYDGDVIAQERERITQLLRNNGYYNFSREYIYFDIDSAQAGNLVNVGIGIANPSNLPHHRIYRIRNIYVTPEYVLGDTAKKDTTVLNGLHFISKHPQVKPKVLADFIFYEPGEIFETQDYQTTINRLSQLNMYKFIDIIYRVDTLNKPDTGYLDVLIRLSPYLKMNLEYDLEFNTREETQLNIPNGSNRTMGASTALIYQRRNIAKKGLLFEIRPSFTFELPVSILKNSQVIDTPTVEYGVGASLSFPKLLLIPWRLSEQARRRPTQTSFNLNYYDESNKYYTRTTFNANLTYQYKLSARKLLFITPVEFNLVNTGFRSVSLRDTIIKSNNPLLLNLFDQHIIGDARLSFLYNQQPFTLVDKPLFFPRLSFETGGNTLSLIDLATKDAGQIQRGSGKIANIRYYQYAKLEADIRYYLPVWHYSNLAFRGIVGFGVPYWKSRILPYEKRFFVGGANSIRAWQLRDLGPGTFGQPNYLDHSGDLKLEGNAELRFPIYGVFKGALFTDFGNVWTYQYDSSRAGSQFLVSQFYKQLAVGSGIGLRFDFTYFVFRLDMAIPVRDPSKPEGQRYVIRDIDQPQWLRKNINFNLGVGYPF